MDLIKYVGEALNEIKEEITRLTSNNTEQSSSSSTYSNNTSHKTFESKKGIIRNMSTYRTDNDPYANNASTSKKKSNPLIKILAIIVIVSIVANVIPIFGTVFNFAGEAFSFASEALDELAASEGYEETDTFVVERLLPEVAKEIKNAFTSEGNYDSSEVTPIPTKAAETVKPTEEKETFTDKIATVFDKSDNKESTFDFGKIMLYITAGLVVGTLLLLILRTATTKKDLTTDSVSQNDITPEIDMTASTDIEEPAEYNEEISADDNQ